MIKITITVELLCSYAATCKNSRIAVFAGPTKQKVMKAVRNAGWFVDERGGVVLCPKCAKREPVKNRRVPYKRGRT